MQIAVVGGGAVGGYLAGVAAEVGHAVTLLCRGPTAAALARYGVQICDTEAGLRASPVRVLDTGDNASALSPVDLIVLSVKTWQVPQVTSLLPALLGAHTLIVTVQNGLDTAELVAAMVGAEHVLAGALMIVTRQVSPGIYCRYGDLMDLTLAPVRSALVASDIQVRSTARVLADTGLRVWITADARRMLWRKLIFASAVSGVPAMFGVPAGDARSLPPVDNAIRKAILEGAAVARAEGMVFTTSHLAAIFSDYEQLPQGMTSSMHRDLENSGPSEISDQNGAIVHKGAQHGIATPIHSAVLRALSPRCAAEHPTSHP
ncbi:Probable ketopantoate reductase ApbA/PanE [Mycobacteroides abscessus subsp. bolletii]|uniref:ketopantoate reductase family protein n=1 Tax=Mycobacteroides abscessus TaxID=36809 RepID=UPI0009282572|nr:2-dehydropantoate 2-reductase [Mycobacteroides abscessus]SIJ05989.1 Probable ketopantoate reductase ApbA/PanE [Mycobacteroides abscessus subsp. bolletii]SLD78602.1 Probable ketopantoate reductase ApbA/PanE [Mycobacteroides abscessus subsp. bolletii]SLD85851.1 Probable ketopantoate reductase ApbA/PanE [Mycobacteroides abscessus subsp. bolletii]